MIEFLAVKPKEIFRGPEYFQSILKELNADKKLSSYAFKTNDIQTKINIEYEQDHFCVELTLATYNGELQLSVLVYPRREKDHFDEKLNHIKIFIKKILRKNWDRIVWIYDEQSIELAEKLYGKMYRAENQLRSLIHRMMITLVGHEWWNEFSPVNLRYTYNSRSSGYKKLTKDFKDVDDKLMAIDTGHLRDIMTHTVKKWVPEYSDEIESLLDMDSPSNQGRIIGLLKKQLINKQNMWDTLFKSYFEKDVNDLLFDTEESNGVGESHDFLEKWEEFTDNRNHIAHNKLLDHHAFEKIEANVDLVTKLIQEAKARFEASTVTDEEKQVANELMHELQLKQHMYEAANVEVFSIPRIKDTLQDELLEHLNELQGHLDDREDIEFTVKLDINEEDFSEICKIESKVDGMTCSIHAKFEQLSEEAGESSILEVSLLDSDNEEVDIASIIWTNGDAEWSSDEGYYVATQTEELENSDMLEFFGDVLDHIIENFRNYYGDLSDQHYQHIRDGATQGFIDDYCEECGNNAVSAIDEILAVGKCSLCGYENKIKECLRCYENFIGSGHFCDSCRVYISEQM
ncbi:hypothetical protein [Paenibacillus urinalis]|uniref:hypothetical protein n=1 Tax=Paenibacillus urinalis TaxID=521520 RepID=UPI00196105BB